MRHVLEVTATSITTFDTSSECNSIATSVSEHLNPQFTTMSSDFEAYEQEFGTLTADITNKIGRIPKLSGGKCCPLEKTVSWTEEASQLQ